MSNLCTTDSPGTENASVNNQTYMWKSIFVKEKDLVMKENNEKHISILQFVNMLVYFII